MILMHLITGQGFKKPMVENTLDLVTQLYDGSDISSKEPQEEMIKKLEELDI